MILVFVHEMGHFLTAKMFGMRIDRFSVGFPPKIIGKTIGDTEYVLGATPLGGYVKIAGMVDESMDAEFANAEPQPWEFRSKPVWQRIIVICAGVVFNIFLAAVIFAGLKVVYGESIPLAHEDGSVFVSDSSIAATLIGMQTGDRILSIGGKAFDPAHSSESMVALLANPLTIEVEREGQRLTLHGPDDIMTQVQEAGDGGLFGLGLFNQPSVVGDVIPARAAAEAGLLSGDRITGIAGHAVSFWVELTTLIHASEGRPFLIEWVRGAEEFPRSAEITADLDDDGRYRIGVELPTNREQYSLVPALKVGVSDTWNNTQAIVINLKRMITGQEDLRKNLGGPVMVAKITGQAAQRGGEPFWTIVALLSITLAIVNILPIPALDGGHLMFLVYEGVFRKEPSLKVRMVTQQVGLVLLLSLMAFLVFNDITRL